MEESNAKRWSKHLTRWTRWRTEAAPHLCKWLRQQGREAPGEFLRGASYKLGSGAVTLLILWWETRH